MNPGNNLLKRKRLFKILLAAVGAVLLFSFVTRHIECKSGIPSLKKKNVSKTQSVADIPVPAKAYRVSRTDFTDTLPALGTAKGYREIELRFASSGYIEYINFRDGEKAIEGDIIASLDQREALLKLEYAKNEMDRQQKLLELGSISEIKFQQSKLEYQSARLEYEKTNLTAAYDGYVGTLQKQKGDFVTPNDVFGTFVNLTDAYVEFGIIEKDINKVRVGQEITMAVDSYPDDTFHGEIESISPIVEGRTRTFKVKGRIVNENEKLKAGMFGRVGITIYEKNNTIVIPSAAFRKKEQEYFVYVIHPEAPKPSAKDEKDKKKKSKKDVKKPAEETPTQAPGMEAPMLGAQEVIIGTIEARPIQIAYATPDAVEIKAGLDEGELIVGDIQQEMEEKTKVEVTEVQEHVF